VDSPAVMMRLRDRITHRYQMARFNAGHRYYRAYRWWNTKVLRRPVIHGEIQIKPGGQTFRGRTFVDATITGSDPVTFIGCEFRETDSVSLDVSEGPWIPWPGWSDSWPMSTDYGALGDTARRWLDGA
jgi:hypothetical protein